MSWGKFNRLCGRCARSVNEYTLAGGLDDEGYAREYFRPTMEDKYLSEMSII